MAVTRYAEAADGPAMGRVHVEAGRAAYRGLMPDSYLNALDSDAQGRRWQECLAGGLGGGECLTPEGTTTALVVEDAGKVRGIAAVGADRGRSAPGVGEVGMINVAPGAWGRGLGRELCAACVDELRWRGFREAILWVLDTNERARRFYERAGWAHDGGVKNESTRGFVVRQVRYRRSLDPTSEDLRLVTATTDDVAIVLGLYEDAAQWMQARGIEQWAPGDLPEDRIRALMEQGETIVLRTGDRPVACLMLVWADASVWDDEAGVAGAGYVHDLIVARSHAGRGLGRRLLQRAERRAAETGRTKVRIECVTTNRDLRRYYERAGYGCVGKTDFGRPDWRPCALYEKPVPTRAAPGPTA